MYNGKELLYFPIKQFSPRFGDNFFTCTIERFIPCDSDVCFVTNYITFNLKVSLGRENWDIERRFSEFVTLINYIREQYPQFQTSLPATPPKTCFRVLTDEKFLNERKDKLCELLDELLRLLSREKVVSDRKVLDFLGFPR
jgi:hypothetical protein